MPDPLRDLAAIIPPSPPPAAQAGSGSAWFTVGAGLLLVLILAVAAAWWWHRRAHVRALRRLARSRDTQSAADALAASAHRHGLRTDPEWCRELERLRFAPPAADGAEAAATLVRLCEQAESFPRRR